jgi:GT2 family glycosyltransferase
LLADVYAQRGIEFEVIVVDDCSAEDPTATILAHFPRCRVLRNPANSGPAVSRNRGIQAARGAVVVGFDSDVSVPDTSVLRRAADLLKQQPGISGVAFRILRSDGQTDDRERWWHPVPVETHAGRTFFTSYFSGTAYAFRKSAVMAAGLFPEILFMHYEEVELAYRLLDRGDSLIYDPDFSVLHHAHPVSRRSEIRVFYKPRNQVLLAVACLPFFRACYYLAPRLIYHLFGALKNGHVSAFIRAMRSAAQKTPQRWEDRRVLKKATFQRLALLRQY